jgi:hypothetical protein
VLSLGQPVVVVEGVIPALGACALVLLRRVAFVIVDVVPGAVGGQDVAGFDVVLGVVAVRVPIEVFGAVGLDTLCDLQPKNLGRLVE